MFELKDDENYSKEIIKIDWGCYFGMALPDELLHALPKEGEWIPYEEYWSTGVCLQCPGGCGLRIRSIMHRPVKLEASKIIRSIKDGSVRRGSPGSKSFTILIESATH